MFPVSADGSTGNGCPNLAVVLKISVEQLAILLGDADDAPEVEQREVMAALFADACRHFRQIRSRWLPSVRSKNSASS